MNAMIATRREFTAGIGAIVVAFSIDPKLALTQQAAPLPGSLAQNRMLDAWIRINTDGTATIFPGKVELGQGITTALTQIAAEELDLSLGRVRVLTTGDELQPERRRHVWKPVDRIRRHRAAACERRSTRNSARSGRETLRGFRRYAHGRRRNHWIA